MDNWYLYTRIITELTVVLDPFAAVPLLMATTANCNKKEQHKIALIISIAVIITLITFSFVGTTLLTWMGTSLASFRVGGGIVLLIMAIALLQGHPQILNLGTNKSNSVNTQSPYDIIVPLAIPMLAGPASISTVIIAMQRSDTPYHGFMVAFCIVFVGFLLWLILHFAEFIAQKLKPVGLSILNRLFGLILLAIAIEIMARGLKELFPILSTSA